MSPGDPVQTHTGLLHLIENGDTYLLLLPVYVLLLGGERIAHIFRGRHRYNNRDAAANIAITLGYLFIELIFGALVPLGLYTLIYLNFASFSLGFGVVGWTVAFLLRDLCWYVDHRIGHRVALFWAMHHVHHSSAEYNMTVASRGFLVDATMLSRPLFFLLPLAGITPLHYVAVTIVTNIWGIAQHTALVGRLGWLDHIFATPSNHRVHHGSNEKYLDRNYGEVLILWDRLFGTYQVEEEEPTYGVTEPINTYNPARIQVAGLAWLAAKLRRVKGWRMKLRVLFSPPGWEPGHESAT